MPSNSVIFDPTQINLDIDSTLQTQAWRQSQSLSTPSSRWNGYLNLLCLNTILPWLREDYDPQIEPALSASSLLSIWEIVNGVPITLGSNRLILIPTESIDLDEIRIPQEWVDIPAWIGDYYVFVQVNPDDGWVRIAGFTCHRRLKQEGRYDWRDRTYSLDDSDWIADLNVLWVSRQLHPEEATRTAVPTLDALSLAQANNLIQRLGDPTTPNPRLSLPFHQWGALVSHGGWRQRLAESRWGWQVQGTVLQWLQTGVTNFAEQIGWGRMEFQPGLSAARGDEEPTTAIALSRQLRIAGQPYELRIRPLDGDNGRAWRFELQNLTPGGLIPAGFVLRLLTEDLQPFEGNEDTADRAVEQLYIEVALDPGEGIVWEIEPIPNQYDQEILRF
ncbi:MAG: DUF1822 family protein [Leptolyngbyaceae cyanobacterium MO_188.B28]|nr:DUF1822 family protein [Leptolyngbyaceae cyanobacterium MO_188.B28]